MGTAWVTELGTTWFNHAPAVVSARWRAQDRGVRQSVVREDGRDVYGAYRWRIRDAADVSAMSEPCS